MARILTPWTHWRGNLDLLHVDPLRRRNKQVRGEHDHRSRSALQNGQHQAVMREFKALPKGETEYQPSYKRSPERV